MMIRHLLHLALALAVLAGPVMPAGLTRCEVKTSCCGCGPEVALSGCCCGPESRTEPTPASRADVASDWNALAATPIATPVPAALALGPMSDEAPIAPPGGQVPLFLAHHAFLI